MRIAFILPSDARAAPNVVAHLIINYLLEKKNNVSLFVLRNEKGSKQMQFAVPAIKLCYRSRFNFQEFDLVHSMGIRPDMFLCANKLLGRVGGAKLVTTFHSDITEDLGDLYGIGLGLFFAFCWKAASFIFDSRVFLNSFQKEKFGFSTSRIKDCIISNAVEYPQVRFPRLIEQDRTVLYCGALRDLKGIDVAIDSLSFSKAYDLDLFGSGEPKTERKYNRMASERGCENRVRFLGYSNNIGETLSKYKVLVVPSRSEGFGLIILEAIYHGLYVLCNDIPSLRSLFDKFPVFFYDENDPESLASMAEKLIMLPELNAVSDYYKERFAPEIMGRQYVELYKSIL